MTIHSFQTSPLNSADHTQLQFHHVQSGTERTLALLRIINFIGLLLVFVGAGVPNLDHAMSLSLFGYGLVTVFGIGCMWARFYRPWLPWLMATLDVAILLHCQGMLALMLHQPLDTAIAAPGAAMIYLILVTTAVRHRPWLVLYTAGLYILGWSSLWAFINGALLLRDAGIQALMRLALPESVQLLLVALVAITLFVSVRHARVQLLSSLSESYLRANLSRFVPDAVLRRLQSDATNQPLRAHQDIAVIQIDIRGFTSLCENLAPDEIIHLLDEYRLVIEGCIRRYGGMIDKFIGDAVMIIFGHEDTKTDVPARVMACLEELLGELETWNRKRQAMGKVPIAFSIGGHYGRAIVGFVGMGNRREFTVLGDTVNVAARIQQLAAATGQLMVLSADLLTPSGKVSDSWELLPDRSLRGRQAPVTLYAYRPPSR